MKAPRPSYPRVVPKGKPTWWFSVRRFYFILSIMTKVICTLALVTVCAVFGTVHIPIYSTLDALQRADAPQYVALTYPTPGKGVTAATAFVNFFNDFASNSNAAVPAVQFVSRHFNGSLSAKMHLELSPYTPTAAAATSFATATNSESQQQFAIRSEISNFLVRTSSSRHFRRITNASEPLTVTWDSSLQRATVSPGSLPTDSICSRDASRMLVEYHCRNKTMSLRITNYTVDVEELFTVALQSQLAELGLLTGCQVRFAGAPRRSTTTSSAHSYISFHYEAATVTVAVALDEPTHLFAFPSTVVSLFNQTRVSFMTMMATSQLAFVHVTVPLVGGMPTLEVAVSIFVPSVHNQDWPAYEVTNAVISGPVGAINNQSFYYTCEACSNLDSANEVQYLAITTSTELELYRITWVSESPAVKFIVGSLVGVTPIRGGAVVGCSLTVLSLSAPHTVLTSSPPGGEQRLWMLFGCDKAAVGVVFSPWLTLLQFSIDSGSFSAPLHFPFDAVVAEDVALFPLVDEWAHSLVTMHQPTAVGCPVSVTSSNNGLILLASPHSRPLPRDDTTEVALLMEHLKIVSWVGGTAVHGAVVDWSSSSALVIATSGRIPSPNLVVQPGLVTPQGAVINSSEQLLRYSFQCFGFGPFSAAMVLQSGAIGRNSGPQSSCVATVLGAHYVMRQQ